MGNQIKRRVTTREETIAVNKTNLTKYCTRCDRLAEHRLLVIPDPAFRFLNRFICDECGLIEDA